MMAKSLDKWRAWHSRPADAGARLPKGRLQGARHHHRGCRLNRDRWVVRTESQLLRARLRGLARALGLRRSNF